MTTNSTAVTQTINIVPVQGIFNPNATLVNLVGPGGVPFYPTTSPIQSGLTITNSTIDSTVIGGTTPTTAYFTEAQASLAPVNPNDLVNKTYADSLALGLSFKSPVVNATTANITLSGLQTIDTITNVAGDRVLVKNQTNATQNGIYIAATGAWSRSPDTATYAQLVSAFVFVEEGGQAGSAWLCSAQPGGTLGTTNIPWSNFSISGVYNAGTGLTLTSGTFSITNTAVTAGSYGSASSVPTYTVNAQGQLTAASNTSIAIAASQITSGTISTSLISGSYTGITGVGTITTGTWNGTAIANAYLANSSITINGNGVSLGGSTTVTANTPNALTINNSGSGASSGATFNGGSAVTISYNTVGAPSTTGTGASGSWGISVTGSAASATTATNLAGGSTYAFPYQSGSGSTAFLSAGTSGSILMTLGTAVAPTWIAPSSLTVGYATNVANGAAGSVPYQTGSSATSFLALGTSGYVLTAGASAPQYTAQSALSVGTATNLAGGANGSVPYQTGSGATTFLAAGTNGYVLTLAGGVPTWAATAAGTTITDDTTTNSTRYINFTSATSGSLSTIYTSSTKLQYNPSTGVLTTTGFSGSGASLTSLNAGNISSGLLTGTYGGTGVNNGSNTITIGGNITFSGAYTQTFTATANTSVTLPTSGTLVNTAVATLSSLASVGTITTGTWNGTTIGVAYGGTGVTTSTGSGSVVLSTSPSLTTPVLGTPTSGNLSNCTADGTNSVGFLGIPINSQSAAYTLVLSDAGKAILHPSTDANARTFTIPANSSVAYPVGTAISFINMTSNVVTIAITTDTMYLSSAGTTGSRSLAQYGTATAVKMTSTTWIISGSGLT